MKFRYNKETLLVCIFLILATTAVYWQVVGHDFLNYDDDTYVTKNLNVQNGLTIKGISWAMTSLYGANWHPVTWISHMLDCQFFGLKPGMHHLVNLFFHIINTLLIFFLFRKTIGDLWQSSFIAALFALHPVHVESVAWIAERKDVLSAMFWFLTIFFYVRYVEKPGLVRYIPVLLFFALGLGSKPMVVTLPFVLLLFDFWPLQRIKELNIDVSPASKLSILTLIFEKTPLFALTLLSCAVTFYAQQKGGAVAPLELFPFLIRASNALVSYVLYMGKALWPINLAVLYPHSGAVLIWEAIVAGLVLSGLTGVFLFIRQKAPYLIMGWLWFLGTLIPVIGLAQVGDQALADRYTYIPYIGLFVMAAPGIPILIQNLRHRRIVLLISFGAVLIACMISSILQLRHWKDSASLFTRTIAVTKNNYLAHNNLGLVLSHAGQKQAAINHYSKALSIKPDYTLARDNLGNALADLGKLDQAIEQYKETIRIDPKNEKAHNNLGAALVRIKKYDEAAKYYKQAIRIKPNFAAYYNLGNLMYIQGRYEDAVLNYTAAIRINPKSAAAHNNLGGSYAGAGDIKKAIFHFKVSLRIKPDYKEARKNLKWALDKLGNDEDS